MISACHILLLNKYQFKILWDYFKLMPTHTCAVDSISLKARVAGTVEASLSVSTRGIEVTVVSAQSTLINI